MPKYCQVPASHHSKDMLTIYHGDKEPLVVCGFHSSQGTQTCLDRIERAFANLPPSLPMYREV